MHHFLKLRPPTLRTVLLVRRCGNRHSRRHHQGAALVMAMVILLILTVLGISAMGTSSLQALMARNIQDGQRAFEAAESGLNRAINLPGSFDLFTPQNSDFDFGSGAYRANANVRTSFLSFSAPKRNSKYSAINFDSANFDQDSTGEVSATKAKRTLHQGVSQIVNKSE